MAGHSGNHPIFDILAVDFAAGRESLVGSTAARSEADRLVAELAAANQRPSTFYYWVTRQLE